MVRLFQLQILDGAAYYDSYVSRTKKGDYDNLLQEVLSTTEMESSLLEMKQFIILTVKDTSEILRKANGDFNEMLLRLIEIVKK